MNTESIPEDERGIGPDARQTSSAPFRAGSKGRKARAKSVKDGTRDLGVIFLLSREGHQKYLIESGGGAPDAQARAEGDAVFANSRLFANTMNQRLRRQFKIDYDPLETRVFTTFEDLTKAKPSPRAKGGKWVSAAILTHAVFRIGASHATVGLWFVPFGKYADEFREFAASEDPDFVAFRERFAPGGDIHIFACGAGIGLKDLACSVRAFFGLTAGLAFVPTTNIQVRRDGALYAKIDEDRYRRIDPKQDMLEVSVAECGGGP
jgi:hypothetical protein